VNAYIERHGQNIIVVSTDVSNATAYVVSLLERGREDSALKYILGQRLYELDKRFKPVMEKLMVADVLEMGGKLMEEERTVSEFIGDLDKTTRHLVKRITKGQVHEECSAVQSDVETLHTAMKALLFRLHDYGSTMMVTDGLSASYRSRKRKFVNTYMRITKILLKELTSLHGILGKVMFNEEKYRYVMADLSRSALDLLQNLSIYRTKISGHADSTARMIKRHSRVDVIKVVTRIHARIVRSGPPRSSLWPSNGNRQPSTSWTDPSMELTLVG